MSAVMNADMQDDMAEFGAALNAGRVGKLTGTELNCSIAERAIPTHWQIVDERPQVTNGCDQQGRYRHAPNAATTCTTTDERGVESKWESADGEVMAFFGRLSLKLLKASVLIFSALLLVDALNAVLSRLV